MSQIDNEINNILLKIFNQRDIPKYTEYFLKKHVSITSNEIKNLLLKLNNKENVKAYYNYKTMNCDSIGVIDIEGNRIIDFNDDYCDMVNKGIDFMKLGDNFKNM